MLNQHEHDVNAFGKQALHEYTFARLFLKFLGALIAHHLSAFCVGRIGAETNLLLLQALLEKRQRAVILGYFVEQVGEIAERFNGQGVIFAEFLFPPC